MIIPTCENVKSPALKALVHAGTLLLHLVIAAYHARNVVYHLAHCARRR